MEEIIYSTKYALLSIKDYQALNEAISKAKGYPDDSDTERYAPIEPILDKSGLCVMEITPDVQIYHSGVIQGIQLFDNFEALNNEL